MANNLGVAQGSIKVNTSELKNADIALRGAGQSMLNFGTQAVKAFGYVVGKAAEFEKEMDFVQAVTQATAGEMAKLEEKAISLAKNSVYGPIALAQAFTDLAKAGVSVQDIIDGVGEASVQLATAADVPIPFAGENLANIMNTFGASADEATYYSDQLAGSANASAVELSDIVTTMKYAGPVAHALGLDIATVNDALSLLGKVGIKGSTAGTSLRQIMLNLSPATDKASDRLKQLGIITEDGSNQFFDAAGEAKDLSEVFGILGDATKDLNSEQKVGVLRDLFGVRAVPAALELMNKGREGFVAIREEIERTTAADVAAKRMDNLDGSIKRLKATLEAMFVTAGGPFQKMLKGWVDGARNILLWIDKLPGPLKTFLVGAVGVIGVLSILSGVFLLTIGNIVRMVRVIGEIKNAFSFFAGAARAATAANGALSASFLANPIFLVVAAITAIIAALVLLYFHFKPFRDFVDELWQAIQRLWDRILGGVRDLWKGIKDFGGKIAKAWDALVAGFKNPFASIGDGVGKVEGFFQRIGAAARRAIDSIIKGFKELPGQIVGFFSRLKDTIFGFFSRLGGTISKAFTGALDAVGRFFQRIGKWFADLPGNIAKALSGFADMIGRGLKTAMDAIVNFVSEAPGKFARMVGLIIGKMARFGIDFVLALINGFTGAVKAVVSFGIRFGKALISGIISAVMKIYDFLTAMPGRVFGFLKLVLTKVIGFGIEFVKSGINMAIGFVEGIVTFVMRLPGLLFDILMSALNWVLSFIPQMASAGWNIGFGFFQAIWDFISGIPGAFINFLSNALSAVWGFVSEFASAAWSIGSGVFENIIRFFMDLPGNIVSLLWDAVNAIGGFAVEMFNKAKSIASSLWEGFKDGLGIHSPSFIERAMWDIEGNMTDSMGNLKSNVRTLQNMGNRLPTLNAGLLGLPPSGEVAVNANGGGQIWQQNAPLIGSAEIRDQRDVVDLARRLDAERAKQSRARGAA